MKAWRGSSGLAMARFFSAEWANGLFSIFVGGLSEVADEGEICRIFSRFSKVVDVHILSWGEKRRSYAFVCFLHWSRVLRECNDLVVGGENVFMAKASQR